MNISEIKVIGFDADDTLWHNENLFHDAERKVSTLLSEYQSPASIRALIYERQMANLPLYGYGIKAYTIALLETAFEASGGTVPCVTLQEIINTGKEMLREPVILFDHVEEVLKTMAQAFRLIVVTKGDLVDQERKLKESGLGHLFHHIEIMSRKDESAYSALLSRLDIMPENFLMVGNSLKSDIIPVLNIGGQAIHIPYQTTWEHEQAPQPDSERMHTVTSIKELPALVQTDS